MRLRRASMESPRGVAAPLLPGYPFLLIQYSSEARRYAFLVFFTMASFAVTQESLERPRALWNMLFAVCAIFGFLSHLTYSFAYAALIAWSVWHRIRRDGWRSRPQIIPLVCGILIPCAFVLFL